MSAGMIVWMGVTGSASVVVADTNIRTTDGNAVTLGQYDTAAWLYTGSEWYLMFTSANQ
jgi:hypothetical protein